MLAPPGVLKHGNEIIYEGFWIKNKKFGLEFKPKANFLLSDGDSERAIRKRKLTRSGFVFKIAATAELPFAPPKQQLQWGK